MRPMKSPSRRFSMESGLYLDSCRHRPCHERTRGGKRLNVGNRAQSRQVGTHVRPRTSRRVRIDDLRLSCPLTTLLAFLFVLGVLIFVHELGHFLAARRHGVRVLTFSLGFGPKILKVTRGDTEYCVSAISARRLREDGRRKPRGSAVRTARRVPVQDQVAALSRSCLPGRR